jgi:chromosome segregation ATPase
VQSEDPKQPASSEDLPAVFHENAQRTTLTPPLVRAEDLNDDWANGDNSTSTTSPKTPVTSRQGSSLLIPGSVYSNTPLSNSGSVDSNSMLTPSSQKRNLTDSMSKLQASSRSLLKIYMENQLEQNAEEIAEYEDVINQLAANIHTLQSENDVLQNELLGLNSVYTGLNADYQALQKSFEEAQTAVAGKEGSLKWQVDELTTAVAECNHQIAALQDLYEDEKCRHSLAVEESNALRETIYSLESELEDQRVALADIAEYEQRFLIQSDEMDRMRADIESYENDIANLQEEVEIKDKEVALTEKLLDEIQLTMQEKRITIGSAGRSSAVNTPVVIAGTSLLQEFNGMPSPFPAEPAQDSEETRKLRTELNALERKLKESCRDFDEELRAFDVVNDRLRSELTELMDRFVLAEAELSASGLVDVACQQQLNDMIIDNQSLSQSVIDLSSQCRLLSDNYLDSKQKLELMIEKEISQQFIIDRMTDEAFSYRATIQHLTEECDDVKAKLDASEDSVDILMQEAAAQRQRIDSLISNFPLVGAPMLTNMTESRQFHDDPRNEIGHLVPSVDNANASLDTMELKVVGFQRAVADLTSQVECERAQATQKANRIVELSAEWEKVKFDLDMKTADYQGQQIHISRLTEDLAILRSEMESSSFELQKDIKRLELELLDACQLVEEKDSEVRELHVSNGELEEFAREAAEREQAYTDEISRLRFDAKGLEEQIALLTSQCELLEELNEASSASVMRLEEELAQSKLDCLEREKTLLEDINLLSVESYSERNRVQSDVKETIDNLLTELKMLEHEKNASHVVVETQRSTISKIESALSEKSASCMNQQRTLGDIASILSNFVQGMAFTQESLVRSLEEKLNAYNCRIDNAVNTMYVSVDSLRIFYEQQLDGLRSELDAAELSEEGMTEERLQLLETLKEHLLGKDELERSLSAYRSQVDGLNAQMRELFDQNARNTDGSAEELSKLSDRIGCAERRAEELTVNGAQAFAKSSRSIAYLEQECNRLNAIGDYYRGVNFKLMQELKSVQEEVLQIGGLRHQTQVLEHTVQALQIELDSVEFVIADKERSLLEAQATIQAAEVESSRRLDTASLEWHEIEKNSAAKFDQLNIDIIAATLLLEQQTKSYEKDVSELKDKVELLECSLVQSRIEVDGLNAGLAEKIAENRAHNETIFTLQAQQQSLILDAEIARDSFEKKKSEFDFVLTSKNQRIKDVETAIASLRAELATAEANNQVKDELITTSVTKQDILMAEVRELRAVTEQQNLEIIERAQAHADAIASLQSTANELEACELELMELRKVYPAARDQILQLEDNIKKLEGDLEVSLGNFGALRSSHQQVSEHASQAEKRAHSAHCALAVAEGELQALKAKNENLAVECEQWREQVEEVSVKFTTATKDLAYLRAQLAERENHLDLYHSRVQDLEGSVDSVSGQFSNLESAHEALAEEMRQFFDRLCELSGTDHMLGGSIDRTHDDENMPDDYVSEVNNTGNVESDYFASPPHVVRSESTSTVSRLSTPYTGGNNRKAEAAFSPRHHALHAVHQIYDDLKFYSLQAVQKVNEMQKQLANVENLYVDQRRRAELAEQELLSALQNDKQMQHEVQCLEEELDTLRSTLSDVSSSRANLVSSADEFAHGMRAQLIRLDSFVAEIVARSNVSVAGRLLEKAGGDTTIVTISLPPLSHDRGSTLTDPRTSLIDGGVSSLLTVSVDMIEKSMMSLSGALELAMTDCAIKSSKIETLEIMHRDSTKLWSKEKEELLELIMNLQSGLQQTGAERVHADTEIEKLQREIEKTKLLVREYANQKDQLEAEHKISQADITSLQTAFAEAEIVCMDLHTKLRASLSDSASKAEEINFLRDQIESVGKRASAAELTLQKLGFDCERFKSERDSLLTVKKTLEIELERIRKETAESVATNKRKGTSDEENRCKYASEKLLSSLGTTLDYLTSNLATPLNKLLLSNGDSLGVDSFDNVSEIAPDSINQSTMSRQSIFSPIGKRLRNNDLLDASNNDSAFIGDASFASDAGRTVDARVDLAVNRLTELRNWCRDETKAKKSLYEKLEFQTAELHRQLQTIDALRIDVKNSVLREQERQSEVKERGRQLSEQQNQLLKSREEIDRRREENATLTTLLDDERRTKQKLNAELQLRDTEYKRLLLKVENQESCLKRCEDDLVVCNARIAQLTTENETFAGQLQAAKVNNARLSASLGLLEKGFDRDLSDQGALQQRLTMVQGSASESVRLKSQVSGLESGLFLAKEQLKSAVDAKSLLDDQGKRLISENESLKRRLIASEARIEQLHKDKSALQENALELNHSVARANQQLEVETANKTRAEAALAALTRSERSKIVVEDYSALVEEVEGRVQFEEGSQNQLRRVNHALKLELDECESEKQAQVARCAKLEKDIASLKQKLSRSITDLSDANTKASVLRAQGRNARNQVLDAVAHIRNSIDLVRSDSLLLGKGVDATTLMDDSSDSARDPSFRDVGLEEALGVPELTSAVKHLQKVVAQLHQAGRTRNIVEMESTIFRLELENSKLQETVTQLEEHNDVRFAKLREEFQQQQVALVELRRLEASNNVVSKQIFALEGIIRQEREEKEQTLAVCSRLRSENDALSKELASHIRNSMDKDIVVQVRRKCIF